MISTSLKDIYGDGVRARSMHTVMHPQVKNGRPRARRKAGGLLRWATMLAYYGNRAMGIRRVALDQRQSE